MGLIGLIGLIGSVLLSGCDATDITQHPRARTPFPTAVSSATSASSAPTAPTAPSTAAPTRSATGSLSSTPRGEGTPSVTAVATNTANAGSGSTAGVPTTYAAAAARLAALHGAPHRALNRFTTTGDAVYCVLRDRYVPTSCELGRGAVRDPAVCGQSMTDSVGRIQLGDDGAVPECNSDTIREPGATVIAAPAVVTSGSLECAVEKAGVTCVNTRTRAGFFLTPGKYATFS
jgi:hypothetical protein